MHLFWRNTPFELPEHVPGTYLVHVFNVLSFQVDLRAYAIRLRNVRKTGELRLQRAISKNGICGCLDRMIVRVQKLPLVAHKLILLKLTLSRVHLQSTLTCVPLVHSKSP